MSDSVPPEDDLEATRVADLSELRREAATSSKRDRAYLIVLAGSNVGEMYPLTELATEIGRSSGVDVRLNDDGVSRRHAQIVFEEGGPMVEDMGSANGTFINGEAVSRQLLQDGDKIRLGSTTVLKFAYHDSLDEEFQRHMYDAALRDGLTRAFNKRYLLERMETEVAYARRHGTHLSLLLFDVDHFKRVNDTYGHLAGDYVLSRLAKLAQATVRTEDVFARYGGEEFAVLCRNVPLASAGQLGERLRSLIETTSFDFDGVRMPITISVGVAAHPDLAITTAQELIAAADEALYQCKRTGRNRVLLKHGPHPT